MRGAATQAMPDIVEERQQSRYAPPRPPGCGPQARDGNEISSLCATLGNPLCGTGSRRRRRCLTAACRELTSRLQEPLVKVRACMFERARDLRLRFTKGFGNLCALKPFNVTKQQGFAPFLWQSGQSLVHTQPKFFYSRGLLRRRNSNVRKHVLKLQVFVRLVKLENLFAQRGDLFDRRGLRNILFYMNCAVTLRF